MPRRTTLNRRATSGIIDELREAIHNDIPWKIPVKPPARGYGDLIFLVSGRYYGICCDFIRAEDDTEALMGLWSELRTDILKKHIEHRPGTRPWAWWHVEDREQRRVVKIDEKMAACNGGLIYESEEEYLDRLGLLRKKEREACGTDNGHKDP